MQVIATRKLYNHAGEFYGHATAYKDGEGALRFAIHDVGYPLGDSKVFLAYRTFKDSVRHAES